MNTTATVDLLEDYFTHVEHLYTLMSNDAITFTSEEVIYILRERHTILLLLVQKRDLSRVSDNQYVN